MMITRSIRISQSTCGGLEEKVVRFVSNKKRTSFLRVGEGKSGVTTFLQAHQGFSAHGNHQLPAQKQSDFIGVCFG